MANITFKSDVQWSGTGVSSDAVSGPHTLRIDEPEALGGQNTGPNPVELLLSALGGCLVVLVNAFAPAHGVEINDVKVEVEGDLDPDGFQGIADVRPGFSEIRYQLVIDSPSPADKVAELTEHVLTACPVKDTLSGVPVIAG
ncbi:OsmC family protein [Tichowtungia aerotolerans]|uniref:OsmC family peroxiredoxin n=1 Tax=Tichowtungia aerotolerans TaxID=2697043 RepID=A0A6P1M847_9BACT|nr:OsmC family protein [Tichowtungia aerotolerans]QHI70057.1 OsmC family peroxiredoxin [Tichowtungia aerotolerans]